MSYMVFYRRIDDMAERRTKKLAAPAATAL
jgi:hypothetical protein